MLLRLPTLITVRLLGALLLALVGAQAAAPDRAIERVHGSAFSQATHEVAIAARAEVASVSVPNVPLPTVPPRPQPVLAATVEIEEPARAPTAVDRPIAPLPVRIADPRAPPLS